MPHIIDNDQPYGLGITRKNNSVFELKVPAPPVVPEERKTL